MNYEKFWNDELGERLTSRSGENWQAHSPFREDVNPSFSVNVASGLFNDFGDPDCKGSHITFLERRYGWPRAQAEAYFNKKYGTVIIPTPIVPTSTSPTIKPKVSKNPLDYRFIEVIYGSPEERINLGKIVEAPSIFDFDCFGTENLERHVSVFLHDVGIRDYRAANGGVAKYSGPVRIECIPIDLDNKVDTGIALEEARELLQRLKHVWEVVGSDIRVYFSGCNGFHVYIMDDKLATISGALNIPSKVKNTVEKLTDGLSADLGIYDLTHILRAPNSLNPKSNLYKIPLSLEEVEKMTIDEIKELAKKQRRI